MPRRSKQKKSGGLMGRLAGHAIKGVVGDRASRSRYGTYGGRPSHRIQYDSFDSEDNDYSMGGYGAPYMPVSRYSGRRTSGGPFLSGAFGDQVKWKIGDYIVRKFMNPKNLKGLVPGLKSDDTADESSDNSSSDSDDAKHSRRRRKPRKSPRTHDYSTSSESSDDDKRRHHHNSKKHHHGSSKRPTTEREHRRNRHRGPRRPHKHRSRIPAGVYGKYEQAPYPDAGPGMPYGARGAPLPYR